MADFYQHSSKDNFISENKYSCLKVIKYFTLLVSSCSKKRRIVFYTIFINQAFIGSLSLLLFCLLTVTYFSKPHEIAVNHVKMFRQCKVTAVDALSFIQPKIEYLNFY